MTIVEQAVAEGVMLGMGNPLLDISVNVDKSLLEKYQLQPNDQILAEEKHIPLYPEIASDPKVQYIAGGATQNSIRVAQWMLQTPNATSYFGSVGSDSFAEKMDTCCKNDGVNAKYYIDKETPTGTCAVLITGKNRSLVANLSAANNYKIEHLKEPTQWDIVTRAKIFYTAGFFLTVSPEAMITVGKHAVETGKTMAFNLSAPFLMQVPPFFKAMKDVLPYADVCFGNETEATTLSEAMGWDTKDLTEIAIKIAQTPKESVRPRTVVITHGAKPSIVVIADQQRLWSIDEYPVIAIESKDIVDTNGAGDAFVGGFLSGLAIGSTIADCVARGNYAANVIIQQSGCAFPHKPEFKSNGSA